MESADLDRFERRSVKIKAIADRNLDDQEEDSRTANNRKRRKKKGPNSRLFLEYGIAVENFFKLQRRLIQIYCILTLMAIPQLITFASYNANVAFDTTNMVEILSLASLG